MAHPVEWKNRARELWELGWNPKRVIEKLDEEFKMAEQYGYLIKYTTLKSWARRGGWKHFSNADTPKHMNPNEPFGVSGISDPIYRLSLVMGKRLIREDSGTRSTTDPKEYGSRPSIIVAKALEAVDNEYDPGPKTITYLKPVLTRYVHSIRRASEAGRANPLNEDPKRNRRSQNRLAQLLAQNLPIDEDHASLGIVYTNQEEGDNP